MTNRPSYLMRSASAVGALLVSLAVIASTGGSAAAATVTADHVSIDTLINKAASARPSLVPSNTQGLATNAVTSAVVQASNGGAGSALTAKQVKITVADGKESSTRTGATGESLISKLTTGQNEAKFNVSLPEGVSLKAASDGSIDLVNTKGEKLGTRITAPWAIDNAGKKLTTSYTVSGSEITQKVNTTGAVYPIIADPNITVGVPVVALNLYGYEIRGIVGGFTAILNAGIGASCTFLDKIPNASVKQIARMICTAVGLGGLAQALQNGINAANSIPIETYSCYQIALVPLGNSFVKIKDGCKP